MFWRLFIYIPQMWTASDYFHPAKRAASGRVLVCTFVQKNRNNFAVSTTSLAVVLLFFNLVYRLLVCSTCVIWQRRTVFFYFYFSEALRGLTSILFFFFLLLFCRSVNLCPCYRIHSLLRGESGVYELCSESLLEWGGMQGRRVPASKAAPQLYAATQPP